MVRFWVMIRPASTPITGSSAAPPAISKSAASTVPALTLSRPTGATRGRLSNSAGSTMRPAEMTVSTEQSARSPTSTMSARRPGAIIPRSRSPKARAADQLAAR